MTGVSAAWIVQKESDVPLAFDPAILCSRSTISPDSPRVQVEVLFTGGNISGERRRAGLFALYTEPAAAPEVVRSVKTTLQGLAHKFLIPCRGCSDCGTYAQRQNNAARVDA